MSAHFSGEVAAALYPVTQRVTEIMFLILHMSSVIYVNKYQQSLIWRRGTQEWHTDEERLSG